jgi:hypothetical protein
MMYAHAFELSIYYQLLLFLNSWGFLMIKTVEIYFDDLTVEAQENLLEEFDTLQRRRRTGMFFQ